MADLLDIAPATAVEIVKVDGHRIKVNGISVDAIASIVARFPALKTLAHDSSSELFIPRMIRSCAEVVGPIIAAGCGHRDEEAYEQRAATLLPEQQLKLLRAIFGLTFPNGIGSFVEELTGLIGGAGEAAKPVRMRLKKSPSPSPPSSDADLHQTMQ